MLRIRVDWLRTFGGIDYKQARDIQDSPLGWQIKDFGYHLQESLYMEGIREIKLALRAGKAVVDGTVDPEWLKAFIADDDCMFRFFFQRSDPPYIFRVLDFDEEIRAKARARISDAKHAYKAGIEQFGIGKPPGGTGKADQFSIFHLPRSIDD